MSARYAHDLLSIESDAKTVKGNARGYLTAILYLAPWKSAGVNVCPMAELAGCVKACLNTSGHGGMAKLGATYAPFGVELPANNVQRARIARTRFYAEHRDEFMAQLVAEVSRFIKRAAKRDLIPVVRLNGTSDIRWENIPVSRGGETFANIMHAFPNVQFYDYTKITNRRNIPANYHLTFSASGTPEFAPHLARAIAAGMNVTAVFRKALPVEFMGRPVVNGDESDLRFLDPRGVVVGLKAKGRAKRDQSGFVFD
jgi:hypothetical protein